MEAKEWLAVGALVVLALVLGRASNKWMPMGATAAAEDTQQEDAPAPTISNGQAYYNLHLNLSGTAYNGLSNEYMPLFGFVGSRQVV